MQQKTIEHYQKVLHSDFASFAQRSFHEVASGSEYLHNWHIDLIADALERVRRGETKRLIINVPPRSFKSIMTSVAFPAWTLGHDPSKQIICLSYGQELADKHAADCRAVIDTGWYQALFPSMRLRGRAVNDLVTTKDGGRLATSIGGTLTGRGADIIIVDDPLKPEEALSEVSRIRANQYYDNTLLSRLNSKKDGCIIIVMQRLHLDDFVGHVLQKEEWEVIALPAIAEQEDHYTIHTPYGVHQIKRREGDALHPERESRGTLETLRKTIGDYNFSSQYQQAPVLRGGNIIKEEWFRTYREKPIDFDTTLQSWDTASKAAEHNDYSVCITFGIKEKQIYVLDVLRERMNYPDLKEQAKRQYDLFLPDKVLIEDKGSGMQLIQDLQHEDFYQVEPYNPEKDKLIRLDNHSSRVRGGFVYLPEEAHWKSAFLHEITSFPAAKHDDQVDAFSQGLEWVSQQERRHIVEVW